MIMSTSALVGKLNNEADADEEELQQLAHQIEHQLFIEQILNNETGALSEKLNASSAKSQTYQQEMDQLKASKKASIKALYAHKSGELARCDDAANEHKERVQYFSEQSQKTENALQKEWIDKIQEYDENSRRLKDENLKMDQEIVEHEQNIQQNQTMLGDLQTTSRELQETISAREQECERLRELTSAAKLRVKAGEERIRDLEQETAGKQAEVETQKLNAFELKNNVEIRKAQKVDSASFEREVQQIETLRAENSALENEDESLQQQMQGMYLAMEQFMNTHWVGLQTELALHSRLRTQQEEQIAAMDAKQCKIEAEIEALTTKAETTQTELQRKEHTRNVLRTKLKQKRKESADARRRHAHKMQKLAAVQGTIKQEREKIANLQSVLAKLRDYMHKKEANKLCFSAKELRRDFGVVLGQNETDICIRSGLLPEMENRRGTRQNDKAQILAEIENLNKCELAKTQKKVEKMQTECDRLQTECSDLEEKKKSCRADLQRLGEQGLAGLKRQRNESKSEVREVQTSIQAEKTQFKADRGAQRQFEANVIRKIDKLYEHTREKKKGIEDGMDEQSNRNINNIATLKSQLIEQRKVYQTEKVQLRKLRRASSSY